MLETTNKSTKLKIVTTESNIKALRRVSKEIPVDKIKSKEIQDLIENMIYTCQNTVLDKGYVVGGLAAIQVDIPLRVFVIQEGELTDNKKSGWEVFINPKIDVIDYTTRVDNESCLSVPNKIGKVARYTKIKVIYFDRNGVKKSVKYSDVQSQIIQHENDHLDGILFIDKLTA